LKRANLRRKWSTIPKEQPSTTKQQHSQSAVTLHCVAAFCFTQRYGVIASPHIILSLRIAKLLEENERRENEARRVRSLESIKP